MPNSAKADENRRMKASIQSAFLAGNTFFILRRSVVIVKRLLFRGSLIKFEDAEEIDYFDYDLVCVGLPHITGVSPNLSMAI